jgi:hypothetical protein
MIDQCLTAALPVLESALPWMQAVVVNHVCEIFGVQPSPATSDARPATEAEGGLSDPQPVTPPIRRRREPAESAQLDHPETGSPDTVSPSAPSEPEPRRAIR